LTESRELAVSILRSNRGFEDQDLERWADFAVQAKFKPMAAVPVTACPDCGEQPIRSLGRYVSYSTLIRLQECPCGLLWADARIDAASTAAHFDRAYRDDAYYQTDRAAVFSQLAAIVDRNTRRGGQVLDVGGAGGQFAAVLRERRPDLAITVQDVSGAKIVEAAGRGFVGLVGTDWMHREAGPYHTIVLSDSIYYEPNLPALWAALRRVKAPHGLIVLRVPNRVPIVRLSGWRQRHSGDLPIDLAGHNPDHLVICSRSYLTRKLRELGCWRVEVRPSPVGEGRRVPGLYAAARVLRRLGGPCVTPSMVVLGR
jgi:hypothetical protein